MHTKSNHFSGFIACFIVLQKRTSCIYLFGGGCSFANGLSSHLRPLQKANLINFTF
ncbi:MAG: hypothetical protein ACJAYY_000740 [Paraglaciecola sp.]|jgi:hypothetical protein